MFCLFTIKARTLESGINIGVRLLILGLFSTGYVLIKGAMFINFWIFYSFYSSFVTFFIWLYRGSSNSTVFGTQKKPY